MGVFSPFGDARMIGMECRKRLFVHSCSFLIAMLVSIGPRAVAQTTTPPDRTILPVSPAPFSGTITSDYRSSTAHPAAPLRAPEGAPNVLLILLDDAGYAQTATFGRLGRRRVVRSEVLVGANLIPPFAHIRGCRSPGAPVYFPFSLAGTAESGSLADS